MSMEFQVFNRKPVIEVQSASPNHIEAALRDVHTRAPNLQLLIVILPDVSGHYGMFILEDCTLIKFLKKKKVMNVMEKKLCLHNSREKRWPMVQ